MNQGMELEVKKLNVTHTGVLSQMQDMEHEQVVFCHDAASGLKAVIGIHNTVLGPALGGTRMWQYEKDEAAIDDVLRLSRGMTFKAAISGLNLGGGKAVIIGDSRSMKNEALLRRFGKFVNSLGGKYITAEDVGMGTRDMEYIGMETKHVTGLPEYLGGSGDPSPVTAYGVYMGMKAAAKYRWGSDALVGKRVVVQGAGNVGRYLIENLVKEGAKVAVADIFEDRLREVTSQFDVEVIDPGMVFDAPMDIFAPCALGGILNDDTLDRLTCEIVAGGANNQLRDEKSHGLKLMDRNITYAPDFLINSGGLINVYGELRGYDKPIAMKKAEYIYGVTLDILKEANETQQFSGDVAIQFAKRRIAAISALNTTR
jgi:leucine dehydrogenase